MFSNMTAEKILKVKKEYLNIVKVAGAYSPTVEEYEKGGGTYPDFILQRIKKLEDGAGSE